MLLYRMFVLLFALGLSTVASADPVPAEVNAFLKKFSQNPKAVMNAHPKKKKPVKSKFSAKDISTRDFITKRDKLRSKQFPKAPDGGKAPIASNDEIKNLVDNASTAVTNIHELEKKFIRKARLKTDPWSDSYWPIYQGVLSARYADYSFPTDWKRAFDYATQTKPASDIFSSGNFSSIDKLSPAEKYDLLTGSDDFAFTKANWSEGRYYYETQGTVESWMGICHGWAPAAYMLGRPTKMITLTAADGQSRINFYPSDIKSLASMLWAYANVNSKFAGGRCNDKNPDEDDNGRILSQECFDNNPGTFHLALLNQIGISKRSVVMDATYDYEVWNQPIVGYSFTYFNPQTDEETTRLNDAMIRLSSFTNDPFKSYRAENARYVVGVAMEVEYTVETEASHAKTDGPENDATNSVVYYYDLELTSSGEIVGGEWYQNEHPDFLWTPGKSARAKSPYDAGLYGSLDPKRAIPYAWQKAGRSSSKEKLPLATIVEKMILQTQTE